MDSWTDAQLDLMKMGGNDKLHDYLMKHGNIGPRTPIKAKYESPVAQLYKLVLRARVEGKPEPTVLPPVQPRQPHVSSAPPSLGGGGGGGGGDPNGMERLAGETDDQYVARQTRIRDEARARMAAKFGNGGMSSARSGGGAAGGMAGIGSDPNYNPGSGYGSGAGGVGIDSLVSGFGSALGTITTSVSSLIQEDQVQSLKAAGGSFWGQLASGVSSVASSITQPDGAGGADGLAQLQREIAQQKPAASVYKGFGSDTFGGGGTTNSTATSSTHSFGVTGGSAASLQEAPGLPGEDRNGVERLTGESDDQYVVRQTRLRDEAKARMAAKFGNNAASSMGGVGPSSGSRPPAVSPSSGNSFGFASNPSHPGGIRSAPTSGNAPAIVPNLQGPPPAWASSAAPSTTTPPRSLTPPKKQMNSTDFFSSFGT
jgi:hypothetical protein